MASWLLISLELIFLRVTCALTFYTFNEKHEKCFWGNDADGIWFGNYLTDINYINLVTHHIKSRRRQSFCSFWFTDVASVCLLYLIHLRFISSSLRRVGHPSFKRATCLLLWMEQRAACSQTAGGLHDKTLPPLSPVWSMGTEWLSLSTGGMEERYMANGPVAEMNGGRREGEGNNERQLRGSKREKKLN